MGQIMEPAVFLRQYFFYSMIAIRTIE